MSDARPQVCDDDSGTVLVRWNGQVVKSWAYACDAKWREAIIAANNFASGITHAIRNR